MTDETQTREVGSEDAGRRLDHLLAEWLELSRSQTRRLLERGMVSVDGRSVAATEKGASLVAGSHVAVAPFTRPESERAVPEPELPLRVLAEGPGWLAVDKPAGMPVHPLDVGERGTILNAICARDPDVHGVGEGALRSGVVHRLDVETSGVLLFGTREESWKRLRDAFRTHQVDKVYRAIVLGRMEGEGDVELPLVTARHRPARVRVVGFSERDRTRGARSAVMHWRALEPLKGATLVEVRPVTGFLHQIRVVMAHLGAPLAGDRTYGPPEDATGAARHMLHASQIGFEEVQADCPDAADFTEAVERLRAS
jgi:23S rRNA pseudouridine1911/1915/1917 synthase